MPRLSSIGRQAARAAASSRSCAAESSRLPMMAWAASATSSTRAATAPRLTRAAVMMPPASRRQADARADHRDVHLRARDKAEVGVARARRPGRQQERHDDLALAERQLAGPEHDVLDREVAPALGAGQARQRRRPRSGPARCRPPASRCRGCRREWRAPAPGSSRSGWRPPRRRATPARGGGCSLSSCARHRGSDPPAALLLGDRTGLRGSV